MILSGKKAFDALKSKLTYKLQKLNIKPSLKAIYLGYNTASEKYLTNKNRIMKELNIDFEVIHIPKPTKSQIESLIYKLNKDKYVNGIIIQLPLPDNFKIYQHELLNLIDPFKDVDCLSVINFGSLFINKYRIIPATPEGIITLLNFYKIKINGSKVTIVGRSNLVGKPLAIAMLHKNATVIICHSKTQNLKELTLISDIVVLATGNAKFFTAEYFRPKQTIIDVGINISSEGKIVGDVDFDKVKEVVENITPVPGGVGPMTIYGLVKNLITLTKIQIKNQSL